MAEMRNAIVHGQFADRLRALRTDRQRGV
jgi:hypothetical protein